MPGTWGKGDAPGLGNGVLAPGPGAGVREAELARSHGVSGEYQLGCLGDFCWVPVAWSLEKALFSGSPAVL